MPRPREPPVYFIDHCLGRKLVVAALREAGADARAMVDEGFAEDIIDEKWLPVVAARGWAIITKDKRIARRPLERDAIVASGAGAFIVTAGKLQGGEIAALLARILPKMNRIWATRERPFIARISASGGVEMREGGARSGSVRR